MKKQIKQENLTLTDVIETLDILLDIAEEYYIKYSSSDQIAHCNDVYVALEERMEKNAKIKNSLRRELGFVMDLVD